MPASDANNRPPQAAPRNERRSKYIFEFIPKLLLRSREHQLDEFLGDVRLQSFGVALADANDVGDDATAAALLVFEYLSRAWPRQASPSIGAWILPRRIVDVASFGIDD